MHTMKLYGAGQSRSFRALWALEEAGLDYKYIPIQLGGSDENGAASKKYRSLNPQGKVPTLVDGDFILTESGALLNYIVSKCPGLGPSPSRDIQLRAKYDELIFFVLTELEQGLWMDVKHRFALPEPQRVPEVLATARWEYNKAIQTLQSMFDGNGYAIGGRFSMADVMLAHTLAWAKNSAWDVPENLSNYQNRMYDREACKRALLKLESVENI